MANYLYNGRELPALPDWDKEKYPYACLSDAYGTDTLNGNLEYHYLGFVQLCCFDEPIDFVGKIGDKYGHIPANIRTQFFKLVDGEWVDKGETSYIGSCLVFWSNTDVYFKTNDELGELSGTLYLAASDPVPVETETSPIPADLYIKENGKVYKVDMYRVRNGAPPVLQEKTATENGEYVADSGYEGLSKVTVEVPPNVIGGFEINITENGTYPLVAPDGYDGVSSATVNVNVPEPVLQEKTVTENGEVTADEGYEGLKKVTVNVPTYLTVETEEQATDTETIPIVDGQVIVVTGA